MPRKTRDIHVNQTKPGGRRRRGGRYQPTPPSEKKTTSPTKRTEREPLEDSVRDALRLKKAFAFEYRCRVLESTGKRSSYRPHGEYSETRPWMDLIEKLKKNGIDDPIQYVRTLFDMFSFWPVKAERKDKQREPSLDYVLLVVVPPSEEFSTAVTPAFLASRDVLKYYEDNLHYRRPLKIDKFRGDVETAITRFETTADHKGDTDALARVFLTKDLSIRPLYRYMISYELVIENPLSPEVKRTSRIFRGICDRFRLSAYRQYLAAPEIEKKIHGKSLPESFFRDAEDWYETLISPDEDRR